MAASAPPSELTRSVERSGKILYLAPGVTVAAADIDAAFRWLYQWDLAVPLRPYDQLAERFGHEEERKLTKELVLDLRQMVYDPRVLFVNDRVIAVDNFLNEWEWQRGQHREADPYCPLCFLRAVWKTKPQLLALPAGWIIEEAKAV